MIAYPDQGSPRRGVCGPSPTQEEAAVAGNPEACQLGVRLRSRPDSALGSVMQSSDLTRAVLGTLADAYPIAINVNALAGEVHCEPDALRRHLRLLHDVGAVHSHGKGSLMESAVMTEAGLSLVRRHSDALS